MVRTGHWAGRIHGRSKLKMQNPRPLAMVKKYIFCIFFDTFCIVYNQYSASFTCISTYFSFCPNGNTPVDLDFRVKGTDEMIKIVQIKIDLSQSSTTVIIY